MGAKSVGKSDMLDAYYPLLAKINDPKDLRQLDYKQLLDLAEEIRKFLIKNVSATGGHLGPNLGVVELTLAMHLVFESPKDPFIFDTGHQSYVHKILTGRAKDFPCLRQKDGLSGYPSRQESAHDWVENSHASTSLSWAEGIAKGIRLRGEKNRTVVAVIGDGALTGGMAWEALDNIAVDEDLPLVIIVNDNGRSYSPTVGGLSRQLSGFRTDPRYEETLNVLRKTLKGAPLIGQPLFELLHGLKAGIKDVLAPQSLFSDLGIKYLGPINGHNLEALAVALQQAKNYGGPIIVHVITQKGKGFKAAEQYSEDLFHSVGKIDDVTGKKLVVDDRKSWTDIFSDEIVKIGRDKENVACITAAMLHPVGLAKFAEEFPERTFDVGIAEQHAVTFAAGLAATGIHPVVAFYSTFLNRAFDQILLDVGMHKAGVTFVLDRSGVTGTDGASHNGMWDVPLLSIVPGLRLAAPRDEQRLRAALRTAVDVDDVPTVIRYSKEKLSQPVPSVKTEGGIDFLKVSHNPRVLIVSYGQFAALALETAKKLESLGFAADVVDPVWALPISSELVELSEKYELVATLEDNLVAGGMGEQLEISSRNPNMCHFGVPRKYLPHASRGELLEQMGLTPEAISQVISSRLRA